MLRLPGFNFIAPTSLREIVAVLADQQQAAMLVAGGTDVYPKLKRRQFMPSTLVSVRKVQGLTDVRGSAKAGLTLGACVTLSQLAANDEICGHYGGLAASAGAVSTPVLRNMGTLGGNLCLDTRCNYYDQTHEWRQAIGWCKKAPGPGLVSDQVPCRVAPASPKCLAVSSTDTAPMLIALGAQVTLLSAKGERTIPLEHLYHNDGMRFLSKQPDELLTYVHLPPADGVRSAYLKLRRRGAFDFPVLGAAVAVRMDGSMVRQARVALGGVASCPILVEAAGQAMVGKRLCEETIEAAAQAAFGPAKPMDNTDYALFYRKKMVPVYVTRAIVAASKEEKPRSA